MNSKTTIWVSWDCETRTYLGQIKFLTHQGMLSTMVIIIGNGFRDPNSNPELHTCERHESISFLSSYVLIVG